MLRFRQSVWSPKGDTPAGHHRAWTSLESPEANPHPSQVSRTHVLALRPTSCHVAARDPLLVAKPPPVAATHTFRPPLCALPPTCPCCVADQLSFLPPSWLTATCVWPASHLRAPHLPPARPRPHRTPRLSQAIAHCKAQHGRRKPAHATPASARTLVFSSRRDASFSSNGLAPKSDTHRHTATTGT